MSDEQSIEAKQTFVLPKDRPEVKLTPDKPVSDFCVRDLNLILGKPGETREKLGELRDSLDGKGVIYRHIFKTGVDFCDLAVPRSAGQSELDQLIKGVLGLEQRLSILASPRLTPVWCQNWCGARLTKDLGASGKPGDPDKPPGGAFRSVWATWTIPQVKPPDKATGSGDWRSASWIGLGGAAWTRNKPGMAADDSWSIDVLQAGFCHNASRDGSGVVTTSYGAWYAWDPGLEPPLPNYPQIFQSAPVPVTAGDMVFVKLEFAKKDSQGFVEFYNYTQNISWSTPIPLPTTKGGAVDHFRGDSIEWVLERPFDGQHYYQLADFGSIDFVSAAGETYGGSIVVPDIPIYEELIGMPNSEPQIVSPHTLRITYTP